MPKKKPLGSKAVNQSKVMGKDESEATANPASRWWSWKARHTATEEWMDVDLPERIGSGLPEKVKTKVKVKVKRKRKVYDQMMIISSELEIDIVGGGKKGRGKGKGKVTEAKLMEVDVEMQTSKFVVPPMLPAAHKWPLPQPNIPRQQIPSKSFFSC